VEQEPSLLERLKSGVEKTRAGLVSALEDALQGKKQIDAELLDELESTLIAADIGARTTDEILERIRQSVARRQLGDAAGLKGLIREQLLEILQASERAPARVAEPPAVILVVGVNGSGKTTTIVLRKAFLDSLSAGFETSLLDQRKRSGHRDCIAHPGSDRRLLSQWFQLQAERINCPG
jgi:signal recognition particle GTPase